MLHMIYLQWKLMEWISLWTFNISESNLALPSFLCVSQAHGVYDCTEGAPTVQTLPSQVPATPLSTDPVQRLRLIPSHKAMTEARPPYFNTAVKSTRTLAALLLKPSESLTTAQWRNPKTTQGRCANLASRTYWCSLLTQCVCSLQRNATNLSLGPQKPCSIFDISLFRAFICGKVIWFHSSIHGEQLWGAQRNTD